MAIHFCRIATLLLKNQLRFYSPLLY